MPHTDMNTWPQAYRHTGICACWKFKDLCASFINNMGTKQKETLRTTALKAHPDRQIWRQSSTIIFLLIKRLFKQRDTSPLNNVDTWTLLTGFAIKIRLALISKYCKYGKFKSTLLTGTLDSLLNQLNTFNEWNSHRKEGFIIYSLGVPVISIRNTVISIIKMLLLPNLSL